MLSNSTLIPSINFHLWEPCNMRCKFCFATFQDVKHSILPKGHLPKEQCIEVVKAIAQAGFEKINFAGGEPTLCPWLPELIQMAKKLGMTTSIVTNGSKLTDAYLAKLQGHLDWIAVSIDSLDETTNLVAGRAIIGKKVINEKFYAEMLQRIHAFGFKLKLNTVVNRTNFKQDMSDFVIMTQPLRWKIFQVLPIVGQNDKYINEFVISDDHFKTFLSINQKAATKVKMVPETNEQIKDSYVMIDPAGRFFSDGTGIHHYSKPILEVGMKAALAEVQMSYEKFVDRDGYYNWKN
jgi:radical S-adenosyl methionine domain-containing protein 2